MRSVLTRANNLVLTLLGLIVCVNAVENLQNVNHIFNAIHSSMRQWGSSLNHNGVSFFRAEVAKGIQLHHGSLKADRVTGMQWLAFEPEHALNSAFKACNASRDFIVDDSGSTIMSQPKALEFRQQVLHPPSQPKPGRPICVEPGWLHTYTPVRNLRLLYIDGLSAGSSDIGTFDSQDFILLRNKSTGQSLHGEREKLPWNEWTRARNLCELAQHDWDGLVDGFIRMEHGFEIILCDFSLLEITSILSLARNTSPIERDGLDEFAFLRAVTSRYHGIGGRRVSIDYDNFVTAFRHPEINLWPGGSQQPRLNDISDTAAIELLNQVKQLVHSDREPIQELIDWQSVLDMYISRYAQPIQNLASSRFDTTTAVHNEIRRLLQPYMDETTSEWDMTIRRCQIAYIPVQSINNSNRSLAQHAIEQTMLYLCTNLVRIFTEKSTLELQKSRLHTLMKTLSWTTWKECQPACAVDEICFTAICPFGTQEDHDKPSCLNATGVLGRFGYWGKDSR